MSIADDVISQIKDAMKAKDATRLATLRSMRAAFLNEMKKDGSESLNDAVCETLLRKLEKQRKESIEAFTNAGRDELAANEQAELEVLQEFLPRLADEAQIREWVAAAIAESGATGPNDIGKIMGVLMKGHKADLDGNLTREIVQELLTP